MNAMIRLFVDPDSSVTAKAFGALSCCVGIGLRFRAAHTGNPDIESVWLRPRRQRIPVASLGQRTHTSGRCANRAFTSGRSQATAPHSPEQLAG